MVVLTAEAVLCACSVVCRGHLGRKRAKRRREWEQAEPGPERLSMGLKLIGSSTHLPWARLVMADKSGGAMAHDGGLCMAWLS